MEEDSSSIWQKLSRIFHNGQLDTVEQAIIDASKDGELEKEEGSMLLNILTLDDMQVQDIMTPRTDIISVEENATVATLISIIIETGHSRLPVYRDEKDNIVGVVHAKDIFPCLAKESPSTCPQTACAMMREPFFVPETKNVLGLLQDFKACKQHLAVILDEYGGTAGIISIEDVIEEIVGDIEDEYDAPREEEILQISEGVFTITGRAFLSDIEETIELSIESEEVDTIGGYLSLVTGRVPKSGEHFVINNARFSILEADAKQIHRLRLEFPFKENNANEV